MNTFIRHCYKFWKEKADFRSGPQSESKTEGVWVGDDRITVLGQNSLDNQKIDVLFLRKALSYI